MGAPLSGCGEADGSALAPPPSAPAAAAKPAPTAPPPAAAPAGDTAGPVVEDPSFVLRLEADETYAQGKLSGFALSLTPKGEYHVNEDFPIRAEFTAPASLALAKAAFEKPDAAVFGEKQARFDVPFTPTAEGKHRVVANVKFAVCTPDTCIPDERTLALDVEVRP